MINGKCRLAADKLLVSGTIIFALGLNLPSAYIPWFLTSWVVVLLFYAICFFEGIKFDTYESQGYLLLIAFYLWSGITLTYTSDFEQGINLLERRLSLFLVPLILLLFNSTTKKRKWFLLSFIAGNLIAIVWCLGIYLLDGVWGTSDYRIFRFHSVISEFKHYNYIGLNLSLGLLFSAYLLKDKKLQYQISIFGLLSFIYVLFIYMTQSRASLIILSFISGFILIRFLLIKCGNKLIKIGLVLLFSILVLGIVRVSPVFQSLDLSVLKIADIDHERAILWEQALNKIKESPLLGYGVGDSLLLLDEFNNPANSHNQLLGFLLEGGFISLFLFFSAWAFHLFAIRREKISWYALAIYIVFFTFLLIESTFERIANIGLFVFVLFIFFKTSESEQKDTLKIRPVILSLSAIFLLLGVTYYCTYRDVIYNPEDPSTYATVNHDEIPFYKLPGTIVETDTVDFCGYKLDHRSFVNSWGGNAFSYTKIGDLRLKPGFLLKASVYCYVSPDFNGDWVRISSEGENVDFKYTSYYNLQHKGTWQKLQLESDSIGVEAIDAQIYLFFAKNRAKSFNDLKGYVIFGLPLYNSSPIKTINGN